MKNFRQSPEEYLKEAYTRILIPDKESGTYFAQILEFPGCVTEGSTVREAYERLEEVAKSWIESALDLGQEIPLPSSDSVYGGKIALRLPKSLHKQAVFAAERDGTSLNQFLVMAISEKIGASNLYNHLAEKLETRIIKTAANVANMVSYNNIKFSANAPNRNNMLIQTIPAKNASILGVN